MKQKIKALPLIQNLISWSKSRSMLGFSGIPIYDVVSFVFQEIKKDGLITRANSIAFSFFLSLFPAILAIFTLIPLLLPLFERFILPYIAKELIVYQDGAINIQSTLLNQIDEILRNVDILPQNVISTFNEFAADLLLEPRVGLFSFGYLLAIFFASNGMMQLMRGFEKSAHNSTFEKRNVLQKRFTSFRLLFTTAAVVVLSILSIIIGKYIFPAVCEKLNIAGVTATILNVLRYFLTLALFYTGISLIYRIGIGTIKKVGFFSAGASLATFLSLASSFIFAFYVDSFGNYNQLYGSIGTIIVVMLWIQINAFILLIGFELNASIAVNKSLLQNKETNA